MKRSACCLGIARLLRHRVLGYGYSQSGRFLREFVRDGFNADERGRRAFDGLMISSAGAGGGSFNHRFAVPGQAGNSVLSILRPVDLPPFTDDGLLANANRAGVTPKIIYTFSSTEYWARAGSLTHTNASGTDAPLAPTSRLYFLSGTPHSSGVLPPATVTGNRRFQYFTNFAQQRWVGRALLIDLDDWVHKGIAPPASRYPSVARGELVRLANVHFPAVATFPFPAYMPNVWKMDLGGEYAASKVITNEPPILGATYSVLVPQVNGDGNDRGGVALPEIAGAARHAHRVEYRVSRIEAARISGGAGRRLSSVRSHPSGSREERRPASGDPGAIRGSTGLPRSRRARRPRPRSRSTDAGR
jgi:hypothetical protein